MKLKHLQELTEEEVERLAARDPLPELQNELYYAERWAKSNTKTIACMATGLSPVKLIGEWKKAKKFIQQRKRFEAWTARHGARFDPHRGKFLIHRP